MRLETLVQQKYEQMGVTDHFIWQYVRLHQQECAGMSLHQLSDACQVSHASVLRFIQLLGLDGFKEFKVLLKWELREHPAADTHIVEKVCYDLNRTIILAEKMDCAELFCRLDRAENIYAYGTGSIQKSAARMLKNQLLVEGKLVHVIEGHEERGMALLKMKPGDIIFLLSTSGSNQQMNDYARVLKERGLYLVGICQDGANELSRLCDFTVRFYTQKLDVGRNGIAYYSPSGMFALTEILALRYAAYQASCGYTASSGSDGS